MALPRHWFRLVLGALVVLVAVLALLLTLDPMAYGNPRNGDLQKRVANADSLSIEWVPESVEVRSPASRGPFVISGREEVAEFAGLVEIVELPPGYATGCACLGDWRFRFLRGKRSLAEITLHHNKRIRWYHGPWDSGAELTLAASSAIPQWLAEHGFPAVKQGYDLLHSQGSTGQAAEAPAQPSEAQ